MAPPSTSAGSRPGRSGPRRLLLAAIGVLYVVSIPWYREPGAEPAIWLGLPDWVAVALACYVGVAILNSIAWLLTDVPDEEPLEQVVRMDRSDGAERDS